MKPFYTLTERGRARRLRRTAEHALEHYDFSVDRLRLITNETNGIFRIDTAEGRKLVLRVASPQSCHELDETRAEMAWLAAIRRDTDLGVPEPIPTRGGDLVTTVEIDGVPGPRACVVFTWVPGPVVGERLNPATMSALGEFQAGLHDHAEGFRPPTRFRIRRFDQVFYYADPGFECVEPLVMFDDRLPHLFPPERSALYTRARDRVQACIDALHQGGANPIVIHADLHLWNVTVHRGRIHAFDFEDLVWGFPVQDVATTLFYIRGRDDHEALRAAHRDGYERRREWPESKPGQIEILMAGRDLLLANYVVASEEKEMIELAPEYVERIEGRLRTHLGED